MRHRFAIYLLLVPVVLCFSGCSTLSSMSSAVSGLFGGGGKKPSAQSTQQKEASSGIPDVAYPLSLDIYTGSNLNAGANGRPLGLVIKIFQLRGYRSFKQASLQAFLSKGKAQAALGDDLIKSQIINVVPGQTYNLTEGIREGARYLGIVALFRAPAKDRWRVLFNTKKSREKGITLGLNACALTVTSGKLLSNLPGQPWSLSMVQCPKAR